jgi:hypothetical protein
LGHGLAGVDGHGAAFFAEAKSLVSSLYSEGFFLTPDFSLGTKHDPETPRLKPRVINPRF